MKNNQGFAAVTALLVVLGLIIIGSAGYVALNPELHTPKVATTTEDGMQTEPGDHPEMDGAVNAGVSVGEKDITWRFADAGEKDNIPYTQVTAVVKGTAHDVGTYQGSCSTIDAKGGIDGKGLVAGELSAAQCWFAGGGDEIGIFANEDGGLEVMTGELSEGSEGGAGMFRGNFSIKSAIQL